MFKVLFRIFAKLGKKLIVKKLLKTYPQKVKDRLSSMTSKITPFPKTGGGQARQTSGSPLTGLLTNTSNSRVSATETQQANSELDSEKSDDGSGLEAILALGITALSGSISAVKASAEELSFSLPDLKFDPINIPNRVFKDGSLKITAPKIELGKTTGNKISVQSTEDFSYKNPQMTSAVYGNPLNLRTSGDKWEGSTGAYYSKSGDFVAFSDPYYSFRAAAKTIETYSKSGRNPKTGAKYRDLHTIHDWIYTYCPPIDKYAGVQNTQAYVDDVVKIANQTGLVGHITEYTPLDITQKNVYIAVLKGMAWHESNLKVSTDYLSKCYDAQFYGAPKPLQDTMLSKSKNGTTYRAYSSQYYDNANRQRSEHITDKRNG